MQRPPRRREQPDEGVPERLFPGFHALDFGPARVVLESSVCKRRPAAGPEQTHHARSIARHADHFPMGIGLPALPRPGALQPSPPVPNSSSAPSSPVLPIHVHADRVARVLTTVLLALLSANVAIVYVQWSYGYFHPLSGLTNLFLLGSEANLPTYFSSGCLLTAALCLGLIARGCTDGLRWYWWVLCGGFIFLSLDEAAQLHETILSTAAQHLLGKFKFPDFRQLWVPLALLIFAFAVPVGVRFIRRLPRWYAGRFFFCGALYVFAAVGLEVAEGVMTVRKVDPVWLVFTVLVEESLETLAIICFIHALLRYLAHQNLRVQLTFAAPTSAAGSPGP